MADFTMCLDVFFYVNASVLDFFFCYESILLNHDSIHIESPFVLHSILSFSMSSLSQYSFVYTLLGSGFSTGTPMIYECLRRPSLSLCPPAFRHNPSMLVQVVGDQGIVMQILVDMGKTFRWAMWDQIRRMQTEQGMFVNKIEANFDAILLTHSHADAVLGLDDSRELVDRVKSKGSCLPVFGDEPTIKHVLNIFSYLFDVNDGKKEEIGSGPPIAKTWVGKLSANIFKPFIPLQLPFPEDVKQQFQVLPIPLRHGNSICQGFVFRSLESQVVYFSDHANPCFSTFSADEAVPASLGDRSFFQAHLPRDDYLKFLVDPLQSLQILRSREIHCLILDCLHPSIPHPTHSCWFESEQIIEELEANGVNLEKTLILSVGQSSRITPEWYASLDPPSRITFTKDGMQFVHK